MNSNVENSSTIIWTISNIISLCRLILAVPISIFLWYKNIPVVTGLVIIAVISDHLDGFLARRLNQVTEFGKIIDPLADKVCVGLAALIMIIQNKVPIWFGIVVLARDLLILLASLYVKNKIKFVIPSNYVGKVTVTIIIIALIGVYLGNENMRTTGLYLAFTAMLYSLIVYAVGMLKQLKERGR
jgi:CDP-diacylglycerol--glycerol-3-phosphate 3-phosphatidyltransferase